MDTAMALGGVMAGVGVLGNPEALSQGGWVGVTSLFVCALVAYICTRVYLYEIMQAIEAKGIGIVDFSTVGRAAFGTGGSIATHVSQNVTLSGVTVIFLVVFGILMHDV
eukprot:gene6285-6100_t